MTLRADLEEEWSHLDPTFVMGMQRSGTSIMARALMPISRSSPNLSSMYWAN